MYYYVLHYVLYNIICKKVLRKQYFNLEKSIKTYLYYYLVPYDTNTVVYFQLHILQVFSVISLKSV